MYPGRGHCGHRLLDKRRRGTGKITVLDREQAVAKRGQRPRALRIGPFGRDVADEQAESARHQAGDDLFVEFGEIEERGEAEDERGEARRSREQRIGEFLRLGLVHHRHILPPVWYASETNTLQPSRIDLDHEG